MHLLLHTFPVVVISPAMAGSSPGESQQLLAMLQEQWGEDGGHTTAVYWSLVCCERRELLSLCYTHTRGVTSHVCTSAKQYCACSIVNINTLYMYMCMYVCMSWHTMKGWKWGKQGHPSPAVPVGAQSDMTSAMPMPGCWKTCYKSDNYGLIHNNNYHLTTI